MDVPKQPEVEFFFIRIVVHGGKFRGVRGATLHEASKLNAYRKRDSLTVVYGDTPATSSNIYTELYFRTEEHRSTFYNKVWKIHRVPDFLQKSFPEYKPTLHQETHTCLLRDSVLSPIFESELEELLEHSPSGSINYEKEIQSVGSYYESAVKRAKSSSASSTAAGRSSGQMSVSSRSSARESGEISGSTAARRRLFRWQSFEKHIPLYQMCCLHLLPRKHTNVSLDKNPNNFIGGYTALHDGLDGNNSVPPGVPTFVLEFVGQEEIFEQDEDEDGPRQKVRVRIRFRDDQMQQIWYPIFQGSFNETCDFKTDGTIEGTMFVRDAIEFHNNVNLKRALTEGSWRKAGFIK